MTAEQPSAPPTVCYRHPETQTTLRCNKCNNYICAKCAKRTPVGYTCPDCVRQQQDKYYNGNPTDYLIAVVIGLPLSIVAAFIFSMLIAGLSWFAWIIAFFAAPVTGGIIAEAVRWGVGRRRSRYLAYVVAGCLIASLLPFLAFHLIVGNFFGLIVPGILLVAGTSTIMFRLK